MITRHRRRQLRRGDLVQVRPAAEILATLDVDGALEGVIFMPEMIPYIGRRFTVTARVERACDTINKGGRIRRMPDTVLLDDLRCNGSAHDGCAAGCRFYWKEAWLRRVADPRAAEETANDPSSLAALRDLSATTTGRVVDGERVYRCQATDFVKASEPLGWWDARSFLRELTCGNVSFWRFVTVCARIFVEEVRRRAGRWSYPVRPTGRNAPPADLHIEPGTLVTIRSQAEIEDTLNEAGKNRGLWFDREMLPYCGSTRRVTRRVERFIDEATGRMVELKSDCLILDGVACRHNLSEGRWFCPREIYSWWREAWVEPVEGAETGGGPPAESPPEKPARPDEALAPKP
jgi:hypothetical protein